MTSDTNSYEGGSSILRVDPDTGAELSREQAPEWIHHVAVGPDGRLLGFGIHNDGQWLAVAVQSSDGWTELGTGYEVIDW